MSENKLEFTILGKLPTLNDYTNSNRTHWGAGAGIKKKATDAAAKACQNIEVPEAKKLVLHYDWYVSTKHDLDNISFAQKFVQDGMKQAGKVKDDSPKYITGFTHEFHKCDKGEDRVIISIEVL